MYVHRVAVEKLEKEETEQKEKILPFCLHVHTLLIRMENEVKKELRMGRLDFFMLPRTLFCASYPILPSCVCMLRIVVIWMSIFSSTAYLLHISTLRRSAGLPHEQ